jgi:putative nucleotidyltransferase with HDIG domain
VKRKVLFVDDEPQVLDGLRLRLHRQRSRWDMDFVPSGAAALEHLKNVGADVIITDMRMPEMDGATLLRKVQESFPAVVRIVLSGHAELEAALRAIPVAHQFLSKPSEPGEIENVIERACGLQALVSDESVRRMVGQIEALPPAPRVYGRLMAALASDKCTTDDVAKLLSQDMAISAKTLQMVNSAFFRLSRRITRMDEAVVYLGLNTIKQVVLAAEVFLQQDGVAFEWRSTLDTLQAHALLVGGLAAAMFTDKADKENAFTAGLLHDIGKLLLITNLPDRYRVVTVLARKDGRPIHEHEQEQWGVTHAEVGAYLLGIWGLPYPLIEAVGNHHSPQRVEGQKFEVLAAVHLADGLAHELGPSGGAEPIARWDQAFITSLGVDANLPGWQATAKRMTERHHDL